MTKPWIGYTCDPSPEIVSEEDPDSVIDEYLSYCDDLPEIVTAFAYVEIPGSINVKRAPEHDVTVRPEERM